jgi:hypothetical protein
MIALPFVMLALGSSAAHANPVLGFVEDFPGTSTSTWSGGAVFVNPGTGGTLGAADGYLQIDTPSPGHLGAVSFGSEYAGNWSAAGIQVVKVSLNDVGTDDPLQIHFSIGNGFNFWQYNVGLSPPHNQWAEYVIDLGNSANFTRTIGSGTFAQALAAVDRIHFRHDLAPYVQSPDAIQGNVGIDHIVLTNLATPTLATTWGRIKRLYR